jgi:serine/threonine protein phosphatase PrpC
MEAYGSFALQGRRREQKDHHRVMPNIREEGDLLIVVTDGHKDNGAKYAQDAVSKIFERFRGLRVVSEMSIRDMLIDIDLEFMGPDYEEFIGGCTLVLVYLSPRFSLVANLGNSPAISLSADDAFVQQLSENHDAYNAREVRRMRRYGFDVKNGGYFCPSRGYVTHILNVSRTLGNRDYKRAIFGSAMKNEAFVQEFRGAPPGDLLLVCTDGTSSVILSQDKMLSVFRDALFRDVGLEERLKEFAKLLNDPPNDNPLADNATVVLVDLHAFYS